MNKERYLKEIYKFRHGDGYFGLDVRNALFFKMNQVTWDVLNSFPHYETLNNQYDALQLKNALDSLEKNRFITGNPLEIEKIDTGKTAEPSPITGMGLQLKVPGEETAMPTPIIRHSIDLFIKESGTNEDCPFILITDDFEKSLSALNETIRYARLQEKKYQKKIIFTLNTDQFPLSPQCARFSADHDLRLEIEIHPGHCRLEIDKKLSDDTIQDLHHLMTPLFKNTIISLNPSLPIFSLNAVLNNLDNIGFLMVFLDFLCPSCLAGKKSTGSTGVPLPDFKKYLFALSPNEGKKFLSVINIIPLIQAVMSSTKIHSGCWAGLNYIAVSAHGSIYPCHKIIGNDLFKLGNISDGLKSGGRNQLCFLVENKEKCGHCGVRYLCGGGPALNANSLTPTECQLHKEMAEYAMFRFQQLDLKQKSRVNGVAHRIREIMPYRCAAAARGKISPANTATMIRHLTVQGTSMRPFLKEGDRVVVQPTSGEKIKTGDIVCFGKPMTCHRLIWKYRKKNRWYGIEKGDGQIQGSIISLEEINGKVISIQKETHSFNLNRKRWLFFNKLTAAFSLVVHIGSVIFHIPKRRKKI